MSFDHIDNATREYAANTRLVCDEPLPEALFDFDNMIDVDPVDELCAFNEMYGTSYTPEQYHKFSEYKAHYGLSTETALEYIKTCHSCDTPLDTFIGEYCCGGCHNFVEDLEMTCFRGVDCLICNRPTRCHCDDSPVEYVTCQTCGFEEDALYSYRYKSTVYCNQCALDVCGVLIKKPEKKFDIEEVMITCDHCGFDEDSRYIQYIDSSKYCNGCALDKLPYETKYSPAQLDELRLYARENNLTIEEAIEYQTHCHNCGKYVKNATFDGQSHQYCKKGCYEYCEEYWYPCYRGDKCLVCNFHQDEVESAECELVSQYSPEDIAYLRWYAEQYDLTMEEAIEYKTHCHNCGKYVENAEFDSPSHQYCCKGCYDYCEEYIYPCYREGSCRVCSVWAFQKLKAELQKKEAFLATYSPVLMAVEAWKELFIYGQLYDCIPDLIEYFDDYELKPV